MIKENVKKIISQIPKHVTLVVAAKKRTPEEVLEAANAGITAVGENYVQDAQDKFSVVGDKVRWHLIGHLQKNKVKKAVVIFDMIETVDSLDIVQRIDEECQRLNKVMPILIEVNVASEIQKAGVLTHKVEKLVQEILPLKNVQLQGLMTMGPFVDEPEDIRPFYKKAKELFDKIAANHPDYPHWKYLSMGMSDTYQIAIEEGANIVRIGTAIFGLRRYEA
jgi:pyridoxal phosphate enzyme (YggS family)